MSRPIYEPTPARADAELGYGKRQLYRRPAPSDSAAAGCDRGYMFNGESPTISNATTTNITNYTDGLNGFDVSTNLTTGKFSINIEGIYLAQIVIVYFNAFPEGKMARIQTTAGNITQDTNYWTNWVSEEDLGINSDMVMCEALIFCDDAADPNPLTLQGVTRQLSGVSQDIVTVDFSVVRLCDYDVTSS